MATLLGPVLYLVLFIGIILVLGYECYMLGYKKGRRGDSELY